MEFLNKLKNKFLRALYSTADKTLLNATWSDFRWRINNRKIVIWGLTDETKKYLSVYGSKVECIIDPKKTGAATKLNGVPVFSKNKLSSLKPDSVVFILLSEENEAAAFLRSKKFNNYFAPKVMNKSKRFLNAYKKLKKPLMIIIKVFKVILSPLVLIFSPFILIYKVVKKLIPPEMKSAYMTLSYKLGTDFSKKASWRKFFKAQKGKKIVIWGCSRALEVFLEKHGNDCIVDRCYDFKYTNMKEYEGIPIKPISNFSFDRDKEVILVTYTYHLDLQAAMTFLKENGVDEYYSISSMNAKKIRFKLFKPLYLLRRALGILRKKNGIFRNFIAFPIKGFLRLCHIPPFYKPYKGITEYKNKFKGKRCFIVATGPSLRIEDVERLKNEYTFGVNTIFNIFNKTTWRPTFYCMCDPNFYNNYKNKTKFLFDNFCVEKAFITDFIKKEVKALNQKFVQLVPINYLDHFCKGQNYTYKYSKNMLYGHYNSQTVVNFAINMAQYMGFSEVYLLGTDCSYSVSGAYFDGSKGIQTTSVQMCTLVQNSMIEGYSLIKKKTQKYGLKVFNATRGGKLEVFPRVNFDTLFPYENMEYDYTLMPDGSRNPITLSVIVLTYCHEKFVKYTLDSILMQKTKFKIEILIGDDCSKDSTQKILRGYDKKYPGRFTMVLRKKNIGVTQNAYDMAYRAKGKYVAYLEGDDYWSDPLKLQKQVDFLEYHKNEYIACTTALDTIDENNNITRMDQYWDCRKTLFTNKDHNGYGMPSLNNTMVCRNIYLDTKTDYSVYLSHPILGDTATLTFLVSRGDIFRMPEKTTYYRRLISPNLKNATSVTFNDVMGTFNWYRFLINLEKWSRKNSDRHVIYRSKSKLLKNSIASIRKHPEKRLFIEFFKLFWITPNKLRFIAVTVKAIVNGITNEFKKHSGCKNISDIKLSNNTELLKNSHFTHMKNTDFISFLETREPIPEWFYFKMPGEMPRVAIKNGLRADASSGFVRLRQQVKNFDLSGQQVTFSAYIKKQGTGNFAIHAFDEKGGAINSSEFTNVAANSVIYFTVKIPRNCKHPSFQLMVKSGKPVLVGYLRLEYGEKPTKLIEEKGNSNKKNSKKK